MRFLTAIAFAVGLAMSPASALTVNSFDLIDTGTSTFSIQGYSGYAGPILLHTTDGDLLAWCADLNHTLQAGSSYSAGALTFDGNGNTLTDPQQLRIRALVNIGVMSWLLNDHKAAAAAQLAIWAVEYNATPDIADNLERNIFLDFMALSISFPNPLVDVMTFIPDDNWPNNPLASQQLLVMAPVPEPSTWAMMIIGFAGVGFMAYRRRISSGRSIA